MDRFLHSGLAAVCFAFPALAVERAAHYEEALARAKASGADIVVFQRGSDWNRLGEMLYNEVWLKDEFARDLGEGFILVAVDLPEAEGAPALSGPYVPAAAGRPNARGGDTPPRRLAERASDAATLPASEVTAVEAKEGSVFKPRADGAWLAEGANPASETLTLKLRTAGGGRVVRLDFPTDPSLPGNGPGRASNGNFAVSEAEAFRGEPRLKLEAAWANAGERAWQTADGISDRGDNGWNAHAHLHQRRTLILTLAEPVPAGSELAVRLVCRSPWAQHVPGCLRAAVLNDTALAEDVARVAAAQRLRAHNARFSWWDTTYCPRVALMDREGRAVACENKPRRGLTPATLAARVREMRAVRERRDALWTQAEAAQGPERAERYRQSLDLLGFANWPGNENCYKFVHDRIRQADPEDASGAVRWLGFGGDPRHGVPWAEPSWAKALEKKDLADADYEEALARIDRELKDPRNRVLDHERIQRIMIAKYHVFLRWPKQQERRFDVQREIAAFDPDTFWGIGARGELGLRHRSETPMLTYGWAPSQVRSGANAWDMTDTAYFFDHAGRYKFRLAFAGGKDTLRVRRIALLDGAAVLCEAKPDAVLGPANAAVEADLDLKDWRPGRKLTLRVEAEAAEGHTDIRGQFAVDPQLPPAPKAAAKPAPDIAALRRKLGDALADATRDEAGALRVAESPELRADLARAELIRACGEETLAALAAREGGADLLESLLGDPDWLESFLASGKAEWPQALENLYVLRRHEPSWEGRLEKDLATALALQWGKGLPYRLVDRFRHIRQALRDGLLHASFESLDVRGLRWAVPTYGTAYDYQFLLADRQTRLGDYLGAHGGVWYVSFNVYGLTVQDQWNYIGPWAHVYGTGTGNRPFPAHKRVGGVCGTVSTYGSAAAQAHGIPSVAIGQPGHCAYIVRIGQEWPVGNSVNWPSHASAPGWEGTGYPTLHRLYEPVCQDRERFMKATRLAWVARLRADRGQAQVRVLPGLRYSVYREGVGAALPDFAKLKPADAGAAKGFDLAAATPPGAANFGVVWEGEMEVSGPGPVRIATRSDDGSRVCVDGKPVVEANCARQEKDVPLAPGRHAVRVEFSQGIGALHLHVELAGAPRLGDWTAAYEQALAAQPLNFGVWLEYVKALERVPDVPTATWLDLARRAATAFAPYQEAGWALANRCFERGMSALKPEERMAFLLERHQTLRQEKADRFEASPYEGMLHWQADRLGGEATLAVDFFGGLLRAHAAKPPHDWLFGQVLSWGQNRFAANPKTAPAFARAMEAWFRAQGGGASQDLMRNQMAGGIRRAGEAGDLASWRLWADMAEKMLPALQPGDVHLSPQQATAFPKHQAFPGDLLSADATLRLSSVDGGADRPLSYRALLRGAGFGGFLRTGAEDNPWVQVQLAGEGELSGVVLVNRFEAAAERQAPLKVSLSTDGKAWAEAASFAQSQPVFQASVQGKAVRARFVRIERPAVPGRREPFHLRGILVYGKKLY